MPADALLHFKEYALLHAPSMRQLVFKDVQALYFRPCQGAHMGASLAAYPAAYQPYISMYILNLLACQTLSEAWSNLCIKQLLHCLQYN